MNIKMNKINIMIDNKNPIGFNAGRLIPRLQIVLTGEIRHDMKMNDCVCICNICCCSMNMEGFIPV